MLLKACWNSCNFRGCCFQKLHVDQNYCLCIFKTLSFQTTELSSPGSVAVILGKEVLSFSTWKTPWLIYPFKIPYGTQSCRYWRSVITQRVELTGRPCKDRVKAKKKTMSTACITVSSEGVRSWAFIDCHFSSQWKKTRTITVKLPFEEYTGNGTCLLCREKRLVVGKELHTLELGLQTVTWKVMVLYHSSSIFAVFSKLSFPQRNEGS